MKFLKQTLILLSAPTLLFASTCDLKLTQSSIFSELRNLQQSIYSMPTRAEIKTTQDTFERKLKELASLLNVSSQQILEQLNSLPTSVVKKTELNKNTIELTPQQQVLKLLQNYSDFESIRTDAAELLKEAMRLKLPLKILWNWHGIDKETNEANAIKNLRRFIFLFASKTNENFGIPSFYEMDFDNWKSFHNPRDMQWRNSENAVITALKAQDNILIQSLVLLGANINHFTLQHIDVRDNRMFTPLSFYIAFSHIPNSSFSFDILRLLFELGADLTIQKNVNPSNLLHEHTRGVQWWDSNNMDLKLWEKIADYLIQLNPDLLNEKDLYGNTPFLCLSLYRVFPDELLEWFLKQNIDLDTKNSTGRTIEDNLSEARNTAALEKIRKYKENKNQGPLHAS